MVRVPFTVGGQSVSFVTDFYGGIGNRITPMGCILSLAAELNYRPIVFWIANEVVGGANFGDLFETTNLPFELVGGYEARIMSCALSVYPRARGRTVMLKIRKKSLGLLYHLVSLQYDKKISQIRNRNIRNDAYHVQRSEIRAQAATDLLSFRKIVLCGYEQIRYGCDLSWLKPIPQIASRITELKQQFAPNTVGIHLRGTDVRKNPPINDIIARMRAEIELDPDVKFFFASDGDRCGEAIMTLFKDRLIESPKGARGETIPGDQGRATTRRIVKSTARGTIQGQQSAIVDLFGLDRESRTDEIVRSTVRGTIQGQQDAIVDLFGLAATSRIIGGRYSTFVRLAALIGNKPLLGINR